MKDKKIKTLWLVRGLPGSGKTDVAETLAKGLRGKIINDKPKIDNVYSADKFFESIGPDGKIKYDFDISKIGQAHDFCRNAVKDAMERNEEYIFVANTFTKMWEMKNYYELAEKYRYKVYSFIVENRHGNTNIHNVPEKTLEAMKKRFEVKL